MNLEDWMREEKQVVLDWLHHNVGWDPSSDEDNRLIDAFVDLLCAAHLHPSFDAEFTGHRTRMKGLAVFSLHLREYRPRRQRPSGDNGSGQAF